VRATKFVSGALVALAVLGSRDALAGTDPDDAVQVAQRALADAQRDIPSIRAAIASAKVQAERSPAQRMAEGDLLLRAKDYDRAAVVFNELVEKYQGNPTVYAEALFLLGETYFRSKQYLSARRVFKRVVDQGNQSRVAAFQPQALARLVDVALRTRDVASLDEIFTKMNQVPTASVESLITYARGRALVAKKDYASAKQVLSSVPPASPYHHQAKYMLALVAAKEAQAAFAAKPAPAPGAAPGGPEAAKSGRGRFAAAIEAMREVTRLPPDTPEHKQVIDLAWLAIGRMFYETDQWKSAAEAYDHVDRTSPEFGAMLYELASVYVRLGDVHRAHRALELLSVADPNSKDIAEGTLLRGDLALRTGQFVKAREAYEGARAQYDPMRAKVDSFLGSTNDPAVYYDRLSREQLDVASESAPLPPLAVQWAREAEDGPEAFTVIDDVVKTRALVKQSQALVERLTALMAAPNRIKAFPELRAGDQRALALINSLMRARVTLAEGLDSVEDATLTGEIAPVRDQRRALQPRVLALPVTEAEFAKIDEQASVEWNSVSQKLQQLGMQVDTLQAIVNALRRVIKDSATQGVVRDPASVRRLEDELAANERDIALYRHKVSEIRKLVDAGKMAAGFGDQRFAEDASVRAMFKQMLTKEAQLAAQGNGGAKASPYALRLVTLLSQCDQVDESVEGVRTEIAKQVQKRTKEVADLIYAESNKVMDYAAKLDQLDQEARLVVGQVAMRNFGLVRDRLRGIVIRADVGVTEEAWEVREEQVTRVRNLLSERARSERLLDEELREVLDDAGGGESSEKKP
jgi:tetratricopeptide (TPR) repeat protein